MLPLQSLQSCMASKSVWISQLYPHLEFVDAKFNPFPNPIQYGIERRGNRLGNEVQRHSLFLNTAAQPSEKDKALVEVPQTENKTSIHQGTTQLMNSLASSIEETLSKKFDDLQKNGLEKYINQKVESMLKDKDATGGNVVSYPESNEAISSDVIATREIKTKSSNKRKVELTMPITAHEKKGKKSKGSTIV